MIQKEKPGAIAGACSLEGASSIALSCHIRCALVSHSRSHDSLLADVLLLRVRSLLCLV
jgi:hypothetical protein